MPDPKPYWVERLFAEHRGALQAFFRRRIRSKAEAPDLAQEVYLRMLRSSDHEAIRNHVVYLYTVANNLLKEHAVLERLECVVVAKESSYPDQQVFVERAQFPRIAVKLLDVGVDVDRAIERESAFDTSGNGAFLVVREVDGVFLSKQLQEPIRRIANRQTA